jgi:hypothetical protein
MSRRLTIVAVMLLCAVPLHGQQQPRVDPDTRKAVFTFNPFAVFALYFAGDVELKTAKSVTVGGGFSAVGIDDYNNYRSLEAKVRYYPAERALLGFSVAGTAGFATGSGLDYSTPSGPTRRRVTRPTIGTELSYQWIVGPSSRFVVVTGVGLKRFLGDESNFDPLNIPLLPTGRLNIGFAF